MKVSIYIILISIFILSCNGDNKRYAIDDNTKSIVADSLNQPHKSIQPDTIIDASYSFEEAIEGSNTPIHIINQLELIDVIYLSTDGKIHKGQILTNHEIANEIKDIFDFMLSVNFVIDKAIPIVKYNWSDSLSMDNNNSYSFCYRNITYSKHAYGMAIDINPRFNPIRWKNSDKENQPAGAQSDTTINGTLFPGHPVVEEFRGKGFRWGHTFTKYYDDHHFEKAQFSLSRFR